MNDDVKDFIRATAEFLAGSNQARMSIALGMPFGQMKDVAELWAKMRSRTPLFGYPSVDEAEKQLRVFLGVEEEEEEENSVPPSGMDDYGSLP